MVQERPKTGDNLPSPPEDLSDVVSEKERRRLLAKREEHKRWLSWGTLVGFWIDRRWPSERSWTLILLAAGLVVGCVVAWRWLHQEGGFK